MTSEGLPRQFDPPTPMIIGKDLNPDPPAPVRSSPWWLRRDIIEMSVVFIIAVLPPLLHSSMSFIERGAEREWNPHDLAMYFWLIERSVLVSIPVLYIMWRSHLGWKFFGMGERPRIVDALAGAGVLLFAYLMYYGLWYVFWYTFAAGGSYSVLQLPQAIVAAPLADGLSISTGPLWIVLAVLAAVFNGFAEELVMRAYFIPRIEKAGVSTTTVVLITSFAFGAYHVYQGIGASLFIVLIGLILGWVFVQTRRIWPVFFAHMFMDLASFLLWT